MMIISQELYRIKSVISHYHRLKDILANQAAIVKEYKVAWALFRQDKFFTPDEIEHMSNVYSGILKESLQSLDLLSLVINSFITQMSDAKRLEIIITVADAIEKAYVDLREFNHQNKILSLQRAAESGEIEYVKRLYGF